MGFLENIFPLIVMYLIWKVFTKVQSIGKESGEQGQEPQPIPAQGGENPQVDIRELLRQIFLGQETLPQPRQQEARADDGARRRAVVLNREEEGGRLAGREKTVRQGREGAARKALPRPEGKESGKAVLLPEARCSSQNRLRQAVIWSEILARPVALRDKSGEIPGGMSGL